MDSNSSSWRAARFTLSPSLKGLRVNVQRKSVARTRSVPVPHPAAPQGRNWHLRAAQIGRFHAHYIKLHGILNVKSWIHPKLEIVRMILVFRSGSENPHP